MLALPVAAHTSGIHTRCRELVAQPLVSKHVHACSIYAASYMLLHFCLSCLLATLLASFVWLVPAPPPHGHEC